MSEDVSKLLLKMGFFLLYTAALPGAIALTVAWNKATHSLQDWQDELGLPQLPSCSQQYHVNQVGDESETSLTKEIPLLDFLCPLIFPQENFTFFCCFSLRTKLQSINETHR